MREKQSNPKGLQVSRAALTANHGDVILRFDKVSFNYGIKVILNDVSFPIREGAKITLMGQNGAGKSTMFDLIMSVHQLEEGSIHIQKGLTIAQAMQVMPREKLGFSIREFFQSAFLKKVYDIDPRMEEVLEIVHLVAPFEKKVNDLSGGQQARLLLAYALIQKPDILLLDEPTNNLDKQGIEHLLTFLVMYQKTVMVISHDADFLNCFTEGVLYLNVFTKKLELYVGDYFTVEEETEEMEENKVEVRRDDKTIKKFKIPAQEDIFGNLVTINSVKVIKNHG